MMLVSLEKSSHIVENFTIFFSINSSVEFIANEIAHSFAKTITCIISSHILIDIPNCT
jgi:hypothetical protein